MQFELTLLKRFIYSEKQWKIIKFFTSVFWFYSIVKIVSEYDSQPFPEGICTFLNCAFFTFYPIVFIVLALAAVATIGYIGNRFYTLSLTYLTLCSLILLTLERSNGILDRMELWTMIFAAQLIASVRYKISSTKFMSNNIGMINIAMFYSIQMIAVAYFVAGITKLQTAGLDWIIHSPNILLQLKKVAYQINIDFGWEGILHYSAVVEKYFFRYDWLVQLCFLITLLIELFVIACCFSKKLGFYYSIILFIMHIGIAAVMFIIIPLYLMLIGMYLFYPGLSKDTVTL